MGYNKKARFERRLKELRKESDLVREDIRALAKVVSNPDEAENLPKLKSGRYPAKPVRPPSHEDPVRTRRAPEPPSQPEPAAPPGREAAQGRHPAARDERFASYFSSGGFLGGRPPKHEQSVQRNKAIFMLVVVLIVFLIVFQLVFQ